MCTNKSQIKCNSSFYPIFIVNPNILPDDGDLIVVHYPDTNEATLREFTQDGPTKLLPPEVCACDCIVWISGIVVTK